MKTINEIQDRIHDLETELAVAKGWAYNALERYHKEKRKRFSEQIRQKIGDLFQA